MEYNKVNISKENLFRWTINRRRMFNVFVLGLPRSGTSMMMGIIERLGVNVIQTSDTPEKLAKRNEQERKRYGDKYQMNPDGFYEITDSVLAHFLEILSTDYAGCKMIIPVTRLRFELLKYQPCKVIQMWRDPEEIRQSQQASYKGDAVQTETEAEIERVKIRTLLVQQKVALENAGIEVLHVQYQDVLADKEREIKRVARFIRAPKNIEEAVAWVNPGKNRFKKDRLEVGI
jgi:hypothetical protein